MVKGMVQLARPRGFEPLTTWFEASLLKINILNNQPLNRTPVFKPTILIKYLRRFLSNVGLILVQKNNDSGIA